ncbi:hypothetical protein EV1_013577 [Malus domestica]
MILGTRPALRSLAEMLLPEVVRGTAKMVSAYFGSGIGKEVVDSSSGSGWRRTAADDWVYRRSWIWRAWVSTEARCLWRNILECWEWQNEMLGFRRVFPLSPRANSVETKK